MAQIPLSDGPAPEQVESALGGARETIGPTLNAPDPTPAQPAPAVGNVQADGEPMPVQPVARPSFADRFIANYNDAHFTGTLRGTGNLNMLRDAIEFGWADDDMRRDYDNSRAEIAHSQMITPADNVGDMLSATLGQVAGSILTPETVLSAPLRMGGFFARRGLGPAASRIMETGTQGAIVNTALDPALQVNAIKAGIQDDYEAWRTFMAPVTGFAGGVALGAGVEGVKGVARATMARISGRPTSGPAGAIADMLDAPPDLSRMEAFRGTGQSLPEAPGAAGAAAAPDAAVPESVTSPEVRTALTPAGAIGEARPGAKLQSEQTYRVRISDLKTDPEAFQYKSGGDNEGVTGALKGIDSFDEAKAGRIIVYQRNDGGLYVADGHQRTGLGRRLIADGKAPEDQGITALVYREADGFKPEDVRAIAAAANLATGTGSAIDAAKVLRVRPDLIDGTLPPNSQLVRDARGLAKLSDDAFGMVVNDVVPERYGAMVGQGFNDPQMQSVAMRAIARAEPANPDEAAVLIERIKVAAVEKAENKSQGSFFDDMLNEAESTVIEEMKIVARALRRLRTDATLFRGAVRKADRLEEAGSQIAREASQGAADEAARAAFIAEKAFDQQGDIRAKLTEVAAKVKRGEMSLAEATNEFSGAVKDNQQVTPANNNQPDTGGGADLFGQPGLAALTTPKPGRDGLQAMIAAKAPAEDVLSHPIVQQADRLMKGMPEGPTGEQVSGDLAYQQNRVFNFGGETVIGYEAGITRLIERAESFAGGAVKTERRAVIVTGPPAAGKSTLSEGIARARNAAIVDPDEAKIALPEYQGGLGTGPTHEESSYLNAIVTQRLADRGANVVVPMVGKSAESTRARAEMLQAYGYTVDLVNLQVDPDEVARRMVSRFLATGRLISLDYFNTIGDRPYDAYRRLAKEGLFNETANIENNASFRLTEGSERLAAEAFAARPEGPRGSGAVDLRSGNAAGAGEPAAAAGPGGQQPITGDFGSPQGPQALVSGLTGQQARPVSGILDTRTAAQRSTAIDVENLRELNSRLAEALDLPGVRQGRFSIRGREGSTIQGQYSGQTGITRLREIDDFVALSHEAGHHLEAKWGAEIGPMLRNNVNRREVSALDYDPTRGNISEGFAEFFRLYLTNPAYAQKEAPTFFGQFDAWLKANRPEIWNDLDAAKQAYQTYLTAPSGAVIEAGMSTSYDPGGLRSVFRRVKQDGLRETIAHYTSNFYTATIDERNPIYKAVRALAQIHFDNTGDRISIRTVDDTYKLSRLSVDAYNAGHLDAAYGVHGFKSIEPAEGPSLREAIVEATGAANAFGNFDKPLVSKFNSYLVSRRAIFEYGRFERGEIPHPPTAETKGDHEVNVRELEAQFPQFVTAASKVHEWTRNLLRKERDAGLISETQYQRALQIADYVPFMRDMTDKGASVSAGDKNIRQNIMQRFQGSSRPIIPPLESLMKRAYDTNILISQNEVVKSLDRLALAAGNGGGAIAERIPSKQLKRTVVDPVEAFRNAAKDQGIDDIDADAMVKQISDLLGDDARASVFRLGDITEAGEPIVFFWEGGQRQALRLADGDFGREMYQVLTGMPKHMRDIWVNTVAKPAAVLRAGITTSPDFLLANYLRDQMSAWILTDGYVPFWSGARGIADEVRQRDIGRIYSLVGGISGGANVAALKDARINHDINALARTGWLSQKLPKWTDSEGLFASGIKGAASFAETSETGTRLGVFRAAFNRSKKEGLSDWEAAIEAAFYARDLIDFGRHGSTTVAAMRLTPFFNAALQGLDKANRVLFEPAAKHLTGRVLTEEDSKALGASMKAWAKLSALALLSMGLRALYHDDPDFDEGTEYIRATHWIFKLPGSDTAIRIPKPFELAIPINLAERMYEYFALNDPKAVSKFFKSVAEVTSPPNPLSTPLIKIPYEVVTNTNMGNKSLFQLLAGSAEGNRPIVPRSLEGLDPWLQYTHRTSVISKWMGEQVNVSPAVLDHVIFGFTGSWGRGILALSDQASDKKGERGWEDSFITRRFMWNVSRGAASNSEFWDQVAKVNGSLEKKSASYKAMVDQGRLSEAAQMLSTLTDDQRAYVTLARTSAFNADMKRLHPMRRARDALEVVNAMRREIAFGNLRDVTDNEPIEVTRSQKRTLDDALSHISMVEARNALVTVGEKGWQQRQIMDMEASYRLVDEINPGVGAQLRQRYANSRVYSFDAVRQAWPETKKRLLKDGSEADLSDLKADVSSSGYELGEYRQKKAKQLYSIPGRGGAAQ